MELWIRSQRKERLCKTSNFVVREANKQGYYAIAENRNKNENLTKYTTNLESTDIEFSYNIDKALEEAKKYGRTGNLIQNNYTLL